MELARTAGPFDQDTLPPALRRAHLVGEGRWGLLRVLEGEVGFVLETEPAVDVRVAAGASQPIPPGVAHRLVVDGPAVVVVDFLAPAS